MSLQLTLTAMGDFSDVERKQAIAEARNKKISQAVDENEKKAKEAFDKSMGAMRVSYQMLGGIGQMIGGGMGALFSAIFGVGYASITMFLAIAKAQFFVPGMQMQSIMMIMTLMSALGSLAAIVDGQTELSRAFSGFNQSLSAGMSMVNNYSI